MRSRFSTKKKSRKKSVKKSRNINLLQVLFNLVRKKAMMLRLANPKADGLGFWKPIKDVLAGYSDIVASTFKELDHELTLEIMSMPEKIINGYGVEYMIELNHFMIQTVRIPIKEKPTLQKILQLALNLGQYEGLESKPDRNIVSLDLKDYLEEDDIKEINRKIKGEVMESIVQISVLQ